MQASHSYSFNQYYSSEFISGLMKLVTMANEIKKSTEGSTLDTLVSYVWEDTTRTAKLKRAEQLETLIRQLEKSTLGADELTCLLNDYRSDYCPSKSLPEYTVLNELTNMVKTNKYLRPADAAVSRSRSIRSWSRSSMTITYGFK